MSESEKTGTELAPLPSADSPAALQPRASIITVTYNSRPWMPAFLDSVWRAKGDYEVIVADNGSSDGTAEYVAASHPQTRVIRNPGNVGFAQGNNLAAKHARGNWLVFLNPDTRVDPNWLEELLAPFADPTVGLTTPKLLMFSDPERLNTCGNEVHISGLTLCRGLNQARASFPREEEVAAVSGAAFAIRRSLFERLGGFNDSFFMYMEETALSLEAWLTGWRCVYAPRSLVQHDYALRFGPKKTLFQERNRYLMLLQIYRWPTLVVLLPTLLLAEVVTWGFVLTRDRQNWTNKLKAYAGVFQDWSRTMARRRLDQVQRRVSDRTLLGLTTSRLDFGQVSAGWMGRLASVVFNPLFGLLRWITITLVRQ